MSLQNEIDKLKTLQESFNELSSKVLDTQAVLTELNHGKQEMVDALATKNVQSSTTKTLSAIAEDVLSISQAPITINGGDMYETQLFGGVGDDAPFWNLYDVMASILSNGQYAKYGGIVLCEFAKDRKEQTFEGAALGGGYLTCDGSFITEATPHIWNDWGNGKSNRWVAILNKDEFVNVNFTTIETTPRAMHIGRKVGLISTICDNTTIGDIVCLDGNEYSLRLQQLVPMGNTIVLRNISSNTKFPMLEGKAVNIASKILLSINGDIKQPLIKPVYVFLWKNTGMELVFEKLGNVSNVTDGLICNSAIYGANDIGKASLSFSHVKFPDGYTLNYTLFFQHGFAHELTHRCEGLYELNAKYNYCYNGNYFHQLKELDFPDLEVIGDSGMLIGGVGEFRQGATMPYLEKINVPKLRVAKQIFWHDNTDQYELIDIVVGSMETSFSLYCWKPINVLADAEKTATLNSNIRDHIVANITDRNGLEPLTVTFHQDLRNALEEATEQAFTAKNWNIAPAKSV